MKMSHIAAAAGLFVAALGVGGAAEARPYQHVRHYDGHRDHRWEHGRHDRGHYRGYRGRGRAYAYRNRPRCWTEWRRHRAVRVCR